MLNRIFKLRSKLVSDNILGRLNKLYYIEESTTEDSVTSFPSLESNQPVVIPYGPIEITFTYKNDGVEGKQVIVNDVSSANKELSNPDISYEEVIITVTETPTTDDESTAGDQGDNSETSLEDKDGTEGTVDDIEIIIDGPVVPPSEEYSDSDYWDLEGPPFIILPDILPR